MDETPYLRRQAVLCFNLAKSCSDAQVAEHLEAMAAEFHARALRAEFQPTFDADFSANPLNERDIENLRLLLSSSEIVEIFDEIARLRIGEFISRAVSQPEKTWLLSGAENDLNAGTPSIPTRNGAGSPEPTVKSPMRLVTTRFNRGATDDQSCPVSTNSFQNA